MDRHDGGRLKVRGKDIVLILDFGSQYTQLIARQLRELRCYCEIHPFHLDIEKIREMKPKGIILSGGPSSVYAMGAPTRDLRELMDVAPLLGICYGMQLLAHQLGGRVETSPHREYGAREIVWMEGGSLDPILDPEDLKQIKKVWMSHGDVVVEPPQGFEVLARSGHPAVLKGPGAWALQFHPEVTHTEGGQKILAAFALGRCQMHPVWDSAHIAEALIQDIRQKIVSPQEKVLCALSGGVDSSVAATLLTRALGPERVHCVFIDNGLLRLNEYADVLHQYEAIGLNVQGVDAGDRFLSALRGVSDPETKRKIIGKTFIEVFESHRGQDTYNQDLCNIEWLAQGTLYPDVIESLSPLGGPSQTIKSHHNVGGLPEKMKLRLIEPLRELFKDEVRRVGAELGLPPFILDRHPFPGPGLGVRILGEVTPERLEVLRQADAIFIKALREEILEDGISLYHKIWQAFVVLLPVSSVGVQGDGRTYEQVVALRAVTSTDGMTADWYSFDGDFLRRVSNAITNQVSGINRVVYDISSKPPSTIEWE